MQKWHRKTPDTGAGNQILGNYRKTPDTGAGNQILGNYREDLLSNISYLEILIILLLALTEK